MSADADAVILDYEGNIRRAGMGADRDGAAAVGEAYRVGHEIEQDLVKRSFVGNNLREIASDDFLQRNTRLARAQSQHVATAVHHLRRIEWLCRNLEVTGLDFRHIEDAMDNRKQMIAGIVDPPGIFIAARGIDPQ